MRVKLLLLSSLAALAACTTTKLPDPTIDYPTPPAALMEPGENLQTIPTGDKIDDSSKHTR